MLSFTYNTVANYITNQACNYRWPWLRFINWLISHLNYGDEDFQKSKTSLEYSRNNFKTLNLFCLFFSKFLTIWYRITVEVFQNLD